MIKWERQPLYFAVIDGDDPKAWKPWENEPQTFGALCDDCQSLIASRPQRDDEPKASFEPLREPLDKILDSKRLHGVVGAIIDANQDPDDREFYEEKMDALERLCKTMRHTSDPEQLLIKNKISAFEIWFFINNKEIENWSRWDTRARDIVKRCFGEHPRVEWVWEGALFPQQARRFLNDSRYSMLWGRG